MQTQKRGNSFYARLFSKQTRPTSLPYSSNKHIAFSKSLDKLKCFWSYEGKQYKNTRLKF